MKQSEPNKRFWSTFLLGAGSVLIAGVLWSGLSAPPAALGQAHDSGAQRLAMVKELRTMNGKLSEVADLLKEIRDDARKHAKQADAADKRKPTQP